MASNDVKLKPQDRETCLLFKSWLTFCLQVSKKLIAPGISELVACSGYKLKELEHTDAKTKMNITLIEWTKERLWLIQCQTFTSIFMAEIMILQFCQTKQLLQFVQESNNVACQRTVLCKSSSLEITIDI